MASARPPRAHDVSAGRHPALFVFNAPLIASNGTDSR
jgi:hypothetical protein